MSTTAERHATDQVEWCLTTNGYADPDRCWDAERNARAVDHDHYPVVLDQDGEPLFRVWPVGTMFAHPDDYLLRLRAYRRDIRDAMAAVDRGAEDVEDVNTIPPRPVWDVWTADGGASSGAGWLPGPDDRPVTYALAEGQRPAPGSLFVRPNGEMWRLRSYGVDWMAEPFTGDETRPSWSVGGPTGGYSGADGHVLPEDARLVWTP